MQVVPAKAFGLGLALLICVGTLLLGILGPGQAAAEMLEMSAYTAPTPSGQIELHIAWRWNQPGRRTLSLRRERLLAVSFDAGHLVFESEEAPVGSGANWQTIARLDQAAGADGSRRLFMIPEGEDGTVSLRFRPVYPGDQTADAAPFRVWLVSSPADPGWIIETRVLSH